MRTDQRSWAPEPPPSRRHDALQRGAQLRPSAIHSRDARSPRRHSRVTRSAADRSRSHHARQQVLLSSSWGSAPRCRSSGPGPPRSAAPARRSRALTGSVSWQSVSPPSGCARGFLSAAIGCEKIGRFPVAAVGHRIHSVSVSPWILGQSTGQGRAQCRAELPSGNPSRRRTAAEENRSFLGASGSRAGFRALIPQATTCWADNGGPRAALDALAAERRNAMAVSASSTPSAVTRSSRSAPGG